MAPTQSPARTDSNYEELIVRVRDGGQDPMAALIASVTSVSAESMNWAVRSAPIAPGMQADIVAFDGNPLQDTTAAGRAVFVMKGGKVYENLARGAKNGGGGHKTSSHGR